MTDLIIIALAWAAYGALHSWLAGEAMKARVARSRPGLMPAYRLGYNLLAILLLIPPLWLTVRHPGAALWHWPGWIAWPAAAVSVAGYLWSLRWYDGLDFLGLRQWRAAGPAAPEGLVLSPLHRHVRHPWYALGLLLLWTRDLNAAWLATALMVTVYILVGSRLEERKLLALYGEAYRRYRLRVPALIPLPGRRLSEREAADLQAMARVSSPPLG